MNNNDDDEQQPRQPTMTMNNNEDDDQPQQKRRATTTMNNNDEQQQRNKIGTGIMRANCNESFFHRDNFFLIIMIQVENWPNLDLALLTKEN